MIFSLPDFHLFSWTERYIGNFEPAPPMQSKREPYRRLEIRASEFRLLILQAGSWDQDLVCNLKISSHPKDEEFEALSYTWGDVGNLVPVTVNEACIGITTNLEIALRHLRKSDQPRTLWIDALCIDQEDTEEKSSQVQRMGEIFSSANSVLAWLGPPEVNSEEAMQTIEKIGNTLWSIVCDGTDDESIGDDGFAYLSRLSPADYEKLGLDISAMNWNAIWAICERPYWHRVWIIQELALAGGTFQNAAQNRCLVGCGTSWIRLPIFSAFVFIFGIMRGNARWMEDNMSPPLYLLTTKGAPPVEQMFQIIWSLDDIFNEDGESCIKRSLSHLQRMSRKFQATDPRDKLYAFLELAESQLVTPDYTLGVSEVYSTWTKLCIQQDQNLHCLHGNRELSNPFGPSWVPELYSQLWDGYAFEFAALDDKIKRSAASVSFGDGGSVLKARGFSLGTLDRVVGPFTATCHSSQNEEKTQVKVIPSTFEKFAELVNLYLSLPKDVQEIAWRAFILDTDTSNRNEPKSPAPDSFYHLWRVLISLEPLPDSFFESHLAKETQLNRYLSPFTESLDNALYSARCFFVTNGLRVGLGPRCTKPGDEVVLLYGSPLCFVLRPEGGRYRLIGDAFVQDVAPESWSDGHEGPGLNVQEFEIQ